MGTAQTGRTHDLHPTASRKPKESLDPWAPSTHDPLSDIAEPNCCTAGKPYAALRTHLRNLLRYSVQLQRPFTIAEVEISGLCNMRERLFLIALFAIGSALPFTGNALAADCGNCGYTGHYVPYVPYVVQPEVVVIRPIVVPQPYYISEYVPCGDGVVVNQGQYHTDAALIAKPRCFDGYAPIRRSKIYYK